MMEQGVLETPERAPKEYELKIIYLFSVLNDTVEGRAENTKILP